MKQNHSSALDQQSSEAFWGKFYWVFSTIIQSFLGGLWLFFFCAFCGFIVQYWRYYYLGHYCNKKPYMYAWYDLDKIARQIVVGFLIFLAATYAICLQEYDAWL